MSRVNYAALSTEQSHPASRQLDLLSPSQIILLMNREDRAVVRAVARRSRRITRAVRLITKALRRGGRLFFFGAGTSGRLGVIEAAECPSTFNTSPGQVQGVMAGGRGAVFRSREGAEDSDEEARRSARRQVKRGDVVVGIAASGITPFVRAALRESKAQGARTILLTCNSQASTTRGVDITIDLRTGPELLTGSTRLKAGTACKMVLNMLTTASMVRLGKVYSHWMVDLQPKSKKLVARGLRLIQRLGRVSEARAEKLFKEARGHVKIAIVMARKKWSYQEASGALERHDGFLRKVLE